MKKILYIIFISVCCSFSYCYPFVHLDSLKINYDSIRFDCSLNQIELSQIDSSELCYSDSLVLGRFMKSTSPHFIDWQFYLPYEDTLYINLYSNEGAFITFLYKKFLTEGYYSFPISNKIPSGVFKFLFKTRKQEIVRKCLVIH